MKYADSVTKSFLNGGAALVNSVLDDWQDPTYLGFQIKIVDSANATADYDSLPHGLFTSKPIENPYSCYNYLMNRGETKRAGYILEFETMFRDLVNKYPWYFVKVSGLAESWKIDTKNNFRGKEKKIVIDTLESIDMRMTMILDLYRKAVYDTAYMRWAVPDNMRYFKMEIIISEVRPMKIGTAGYLNSIYPGGIFVDGTNFEETLPRSVNDDPGVGLYDSTAPWSPSTFIRFQYEECELDVFNEAPTFLENVGSSPETPAANKITIITNVIGEKNVYGLLGAIIDDTKSWYDYEAGSDNRGGLYFPAVSGVNPVRTTDSSVASSLTNNYVGGYLRRDYDQENITRFEVQRSQSANPGNKSTAAAARDFDNDHKGNLRNTSGSGILGNFANRLAAGATAAVADIARSAANRALLGNVYGISPLSLIGSAQSILNNPAAAVEAILRKFSSPAIGKELATKVQLTGQEIELVKSIIGASTTGAEDDIKVNPDLVKNQGKTNLASNAAKPSNPGKTNLLSPNINSSDPGKADLIAPRKPVAQKQNSSLTAFANAGSDPGNVEFEGPEITPARLGKADL